MIVQQMTEEEMALRAERGMEIAQQILKDSWLVVGITEEQWERWPIEVDVHDMMVHRGSSEAEAEAYIDTAPWEEIQRKHREMYPGQYKGK